ncbi:MAG TPA: anti-sigma-D factor RsdA, partial [Mycobacterium sp.]|nr:anti-sigma-D factor RsdA [Mycobacterium sp.]
MADYGRWSSNGGDPSLNEINRVDQFIEALSSNRQAYSTDREEAELAFLFADWRDGVRETPTSVTITEQDAVEALRAGQPSTRRVGRGHLAVVGSAAAAVLCLGGFGAAVYGAAPGDGLYGVRTMFFGDQKATRDDQVVLAAQTELAEVQRLVEQGQWDQAQDKLVALSTTVQSVEQVESKHDLIEQWNALTYKVVEQNPAATLPPVGEPLPVLPDSPLTLLPVPVIADTTSAPTSVPASPSDTSLPSPTDTPGPEVLLTPPSDSSL